MNIESTTINRTQEQTPQIQQPTSKENDGKFAEELKNIKNDSETTNEKDTKKSRRRKSS